MFASGLHPEREKPWRVAIDHPKQDANRTFIATLPLQNQGLASSGNYRKFRTDASGKRYVHTVNPKTGETVQSNVLSTSVLAPSTMLADAYATALMAMPYEQGKTLISNLSTIEAIWVLAVNDSVQVVATPGLLTILSRAHTRGMYSSLSLHSAIFRLRKVISKLYFA